MNWYALIDAKLKLLLGGPAPLWEGTIVLNGTEQMMFEIIGVPSRIEGYVDLTPMQVGDNIVLRQYMKIKSGGVYAKYADEVYNGNQSIPLVHIEMKPVIQSLKVTIQQTAGVLRSIDGQFLGIS